MVVSTVGHSTHPIEEFVGILRAHGIRRLVDVRTIPRSRRNPQFSQENLPRKSCRPRESSTSISPGWAGCGTLARIL